MNRCAGRSRQRPRRPRRSRRLRGQGAAAADGSVCAVCAQRAAARRCRGAAAAAAATRGARPPAAWSWARCWRRSRARWTTRSRYIDASTPARYVAPLAHLAICVLALSQCAYVCSRTITYGSWVRGSRSRSRGSTRPRCAFTSVLHKACCIMYLYSYIIRIAVWHFIFPSELGTGMSVITPRICPMLLFSAGGFCQSITL